MVRSGLNSIGSDDGVSSKYEGSGRRGRLTRDDARELLRAHRHSGLSLAAFARQRGISADRLRWWRRKPPAVRRVQRTRTVKFVPVRIRERGPVLAAVRPGDGFEVVVRGGQTVRVAANFDEAGLRRLLGVLAEVA